MSPAPRCRTGFRSIISATSNEWIAARKVDDCGFLRIGRVVFESALAQVQLATRLRVFRAAFDVGTKREAGAHSLPGICNAPSVFRHCPRNGNRASANPTPLPVGWEGDSQTTQRVTRQSGDRPDSPCETRSSLPSFLVINVHGGCTNECGIDALPGDRNPVPVLYRV